MPGLMAQLPLTPLPNTFSVITHADSPVVCVLLLPNRVDVAVL
jgi:hypothetical protein